MSVQTIYYTRYYYARFAGHDYIVWMEDSRWKHISTVESRWHYTNKTWAENMVRDKLFEPNFCTIPGLGNRLVDSPWIAAT